MLKCFFFIFVSTRILSSSFAYTKEPEKWTGYQYILCSFISFNFFIVDELLLNEFCRTARPFCFEFFSSFLHLTCNHIYTYQFSFSPIVVTVFTLYMEPYLRFQINFAQENYEFCKLTVLFFFPRSLLHSNWINDRYYLNLCMPRKYNTLEKRWCFQPVPI